MPHPDAAPRAAIIQACRAMNASGLNQGTSGNISLRQGDGMLITPSATPYDRMQPADIVFVPLAEGADAAVGRIPPSTEWRLHRDILQARPEAQAVVHCHPVHCTALAMARRPIPPCHYMIAAFGGGDVRCAGYANFGTAALSALALEALDGRNACLLANHGMVVFAPSLERAMWLATELETLARQYIASLALGGPVLLTAAEIAEAAASFGPYGLRPRS
jgi:L-fuculose-phosphate aldolase